MISVILPVYNEEHCIAGAIETITRVFSQIGPYEIIVVNDGSTDGTRDILRRYKDRVIVIDQLVNRGYGYSLKAGIRRASFDWICITDADGTYPIDALYEMAQKMGDYDMVVGERSGCRVCVGLFNRCGKFVLRVLVYMLAGKWIKDLNSGLRIFKKELALKYWHLLPDGFSFTTTITLASTIDRHKIYFHSINYFKRVGKSSINPFIDFIGFVNLIVRIMVFFKPLNVFIPLSLLFFIISLLRSVRHILTVNYIGNTALMLFVLSIQSFFFGLIAELIVNKFKRFDEANKS